MLAAAPSKAPDVQVPMSEHQQSWRRATAASDNMRMLHAAVAPRAWADSSGVQPYADRRHRLAPYNGCVTYYLKHYWCMDSCAGRPADFCCLCTVAAALDGRHGRQPCPMTSFSITKFLRKPATGNPSTNMAKRKWNRPGLGERFRFRASCEMQPTFAALAPHFI
jgi:hypothetical protein